MSNTLFKLVYDEVLDRDNKITGSWSVYLKLLNDNNVDILLYNTFSENWAKIALQRLKDFYEPYLYSFITGTNLPVMFERDDAIYKLEYVFPEQGCVVGSQIEGNNRYVSFSPQEEKYDYIQDLIFFYTEGVCLVKDNQMFLDGKLLLNSKQLKDVCDSIGQDFNSLDYNADKLIQYIIKTYPQVNTYICNGYCSFNIGRREN